MHGSLQVSDNDSPEVYLFHCASGSVYNRYIPDAHLVFKNYEETADYVAHEVLSSETHSQTKNTGPGDYRSDIQSKLFQYHYYRDPE